MEAAVVERALPAAFGFLLERVQPLGDVVGGGRAFFGIAGDPALSTPAIAACSMTLRL